jgi:hypothetical protein
MIPPFALSEKRYKPGLLFRVYTVTDKIETYQNRPEYIIENPIKDICV